MSRGFKRVIIKAKAGFTYTYQGQAYDLPDLWDLVPKEAFKHCHHKGKSYWLTSLIVDLKGVGKVKLVFVRQSMRHRKGELNSVLMCTDVDIPTRMFCLSNLAYPQQRPIQLTVVAGNCTRPTSAVF
ncbi:hypothetical protein QUF58_10860 [Anaerolineales bacterium HSG24]|nr:hypothetical protein [Anaerolineales bacterium HSG24]